MSVMCPECQCEAGDGPSECKSCNGYRALCLPPGLPPEPWSPKCDCHGELMSEPGALLFSPPTGNLVLKFHVCAKFWPALMRVVENPKSYERIGDDKGSAGEPLSRHDTALLLRRYPECGLVPGGVVVPHKIIRELLGAVLELETEAADLVDTSKRGAT